MPAGAGPEEAGRGAGAWEGVRVTPALAVPACPVQRGRCLGRGVRGGPGGCLGEW